MIQAKFGLNWPSGFRGEDFWTSLQMDDGRQVMAIAHTGELIKDFASCQFVTSAASPFFLHLWASCLEAGRFGIPKINQNHYPVPRINVLKFHKYPSNGT